MEPRGRFARDFIFEVMKDSQQLRAGYLAEREHWLRTLAVDGREEVLFEFEMLLRGLERYFNLHNLPLAENRSVMARDFKEELRAVRDAIHRSAHLTRLLLDEPSDRSLVFRRFLENQLADDRARGMMLEMSFSQATPQESLFLLRQGFLALRGVVDALLKLPHTTYAVFADVGQLCIRDVALSKYFRPFRALEFRPEYDRIKSVRILDVIRRVPREERRKAVSLAFLGLFRLLHYLRHVPAPADGAPQPRARLVLALVQSEVTSLSGYLSGELQEKLDEPAKKAAARVALELRKEVAKVLRRDLARSEPDDAAVLGRARTALDSLVKQAVVALARAFDDTLTGSTIFDDFVSRREQGQRLLLDLRSFSALSARVAQPLGTEREGEAVKALRDFVAYFRDVSYQLLRYGDYDPFDAFLDLAVDPDLPVQDLARSCLAFVDVLDETAEKVGRRTELHDVLPSASDVDALAGRYLPA